MTYVGSFFDLLNPYALVGGLVTLSLFILHGALFLELKTGGVVQERAKQMTRRVIVPVIILALAFVGLSLFETDILQRLNVANVLGLVAAVAGLLAGAYFIFSGRFGRAFVATGAVIVGVVA